MGEAADDENPENVNPSLRWEGSPSSRYIEQSFPNARQVLVVVGAASVNPVDFNFKIRSGKYPAVKADRLPYTLGRDVSGAVENCGAQATRFKIGEEIFSMISICGGGYSEKVVDKDVLAAKPSSRDHVHAAAIPLPA
jgi:NADPH:quinone reductase-like Zn-dependent oxidoreductase